MSTITVDVPPGFAEALFKNRLEMAEQQATNDVNEIVRRGKLQRAQNALEEFEEKKCSYDNLEQAVYAAKWKAEELIKKAMV